MQTEYFWIQPGFYMGYLTGDIINNMVQGGLKLWDNNWYWRRWVMGWKKDLNLYHIRCKHTRKFLSDLPIKNLCTALIGISIINSNPRCTFRLKSRPAAYIVKQSYIDNKHYTPIHILSICITSYLTMQQFIVSPIFRRQIFRNFNYALLVNVCTIPFCYNEILST